LRDLLNANCGPDDVSKVKKKVADAAAILNTAAKSNRSLYQSGVYGVVGTPEAIAKRQKAATVIHQANEYLALAVERAAALQPGDLETGKADIVKILQQAVTVLNSLNIDNENIKLVLASATAAINSAVTLTLAIRGGA
jgi:septum formation topological specificity factor MinE